MKKTLEKLVFKVREKIGNDRSVGNFWIGCLKHRNLDGDFIASQPFNPIPGQTETELMELDYDGGDDNEDDNGGGSHENVDMDVVDSDAACSDDSVYT